MGGVPGGGHSVDRGDSGRVPAVWRGDQATVGQYLWSAWSEAGSAPFYKGVLTPERAGVAVERLEDACPYAPLTPVRSSGVLE